MTARPNSYGVGQKAEQEAAKRLAKNGWIVVPMSEYTNNTGIAINAPMLVVPNGMMISPDLLAIKAGKQIWIEVKDKTAPTYTWKFHRWEHGIDRPNCDAYSSLQEQSGTPVFLLVHENNSPRTPDIFLCGMDDIGARRRMQADLMESDRLLSISLRDALLHGNFRDNNPEMRDARNPTGAGLYWPRDRMKEWLA